MAEYDVLVIGAGVAGLTAAATAARLGLHTLVIDSMGVGGQVMTVDRITNFPGFPDPVSGIELGPLLQEQAEAFGAGMRLASVTGIAGMAGDLTVSCDEGDISCRAVIVAAGSSRRKLGLPGEEELEGRGVSHCASCDGPLFRGQTVVVVGGGDSAFDEAAVLSDHAGKVILAYRTAEPRAQRRAVAEVAGLENVVQKPNTTVEALEGESALTGVRLRDTSSCTVETVAAGGVFVYVGLDPNSGFLDGLLELDGDGRILTGGDLQSSHPMIFAAGDIRSGSAGLLSSAAGEGATAAISAYRALAAVDVTREVAE